MIHFTSKIQTIKDSSCILMTAALEQLVRLLLYDLQVMVQAVGNSLLQSVEKGCLYHIAKQHGPSPDPAQSGS